MNDDNMIVGSVKAYALLAGFQELIEKFFVVMRDFLPFLLVGCQIA